MSGIKSQKHPKGLYLLFFTEMWERFSYYGMRAMLVLYMVQQLGYSIEKSGNVYGLYTGFVYLTPLIGGYIADRFLGQRRCITVGALLMCFGLFALACDKEYLFLPALFLMVTANGFFKPNISSLLGLLYGKDNKNKDSGFTIFYMGINLGAFFSPLVCGTVAIKYGFSYGFASAGVGMLAGVFIYKVFENKVLGNCGLLPVKKVFDEDKTKQTKVTKREKLRLLALLVLMVFTIVFWTCYEQAGCSLTLFAEYSTNRIIGGLFIIILAPVVSDIWLKLSKKGLEPSSVEKFAIALSLMSVAYVVMAIGGKMSEIGLVSSFWLVSVYFIMTVAELCISPIGLSLVSKLAPRQFMSMLMGVWFLTSFFGNIFAGIWGGKYGSISVDILFLTLAVISLVSAIILACFIPNLKRLLGKY